MRCAESLRNDIKNRFGYGVVAAGVRRDDVDENGFIIIIVVL